MTWADEYLAAFQVTDIAKDPDDFRVTRQSKVDFSGLLVPISTGDTEHLETLFLQNQAAFQYALDGGSLDGGSLKDKFPLLTSTMRTRLERASVRTKGSVPNFDYVSLDPHEYTVFGAPGIDLPVLSIHTRPEYSWFLGIMRFEGALGLSLGRMRVMRPNDKGMYPVTIRTKWRALTNKVKQEEVRDAYQRLIRG